VVEVSGPTELMVALWGDGWHSLCSGVGRGGDFNVDGTYDNADDLLDAAAALTAQGRNVWFEVHPMAERPNVPANRGNAEMVQKVHALPVDLDWNDPAAHSEEELPTEAEVRARLARYAHPPSVTICSGHGLQAYWLLDAPVTADVGANLIARLHAELEAAGLPADCADLASILRLPGSFNFKTTPTEVVIESADLSRRYAVEYLSKRLGGSYSAPGKTSTGSKGIEVRGLDKCLADLRAAGRDQDADALDVLCRVHKGHHPWITKKGDVFVTHPDKTAGTSASIGYSSPGVVKVFTKSWGELKKDRRYVVNAAGDALEELVDPFASTNDGGDGDGDSDGEEGTKKRGPSQATKLARLALERYRFAQADDGRAFAVPLVGPPIARPLDGTRSSLRSELAAAYFKETGNTAGKSAIADALGVLDGEAQLADRETLSLRTGTYGDSIIIDLGTASGECIQVGSGRVALIERSPIVFRRTELTMPMPTPVAGGDVERLGDLINVAAEDLPLLIGWCLSTLFDIPRPILFLTGEQGTGKSSAAKTIAQLLDPSPAPLRAAPRDVDSWVVAAAGSQLVALDNLSTVSEWLSDALCRAATGEGLVRRALYTDDGLSVLTFRRSVVLTSIDAGALRGDLGERLVPVELERITPDRRRTDSELDAAFREAAPVILGALLQLAAEVLSVLPTIVVADLPRMADFGRLLAALDKVKGWHSLDTYRAAVEQVAADVIAGDPVAAAVIGFMSTRTEWTGTATELLDRLATFRPEGSAWPKNARGLSGTLTRLAPALRGQRIDVTKTKTGDARAITIRARDANDANDAGFHLIGMTSERESAAEVADPAGFAASFASRASFDPSVDPW
jgi:hypothetical protein